MSCKLDPTAGVAPAGISSAARCREVARLSEPSIEKKGFK